MAFTMRAVKVPPNSVSLEEARTRTFEFFKSACRSIPTVMEIYNLYDVVTPSQLRSNIAAQFRDRHAAFQGYGRIGGHCGACKAAAPHHWSICGRSPWAVTRFRHQG